MHPVAPARTQQAFMDHLPFNRSCFHSGITTCGRSLIIVRDSHVNVIRDDASQLLNRLSLHGTLIPLPTNMIA